MILDNLLLFTGTSNGATGVPALDSLHDRPTTGSQNSSNILDLAQGTATNPALPPSQVQSAGPPATTAQPIRDLGIGDDPALKILVVVTTTFVGAGASTIITLQGSPDNGSGAPSGFTSWWATPSYGVAILIAGSRLMDMDMPRPPLGQPIPRFLQLNYNTSGGTFTAGAILATLVLDRHDQIYNNAGVNSLLGGYPAGIVVPN